MKTVKKQPPNIDVLKKFFKITEDVIFTYGDTIYNPSGAYINKPLMIHEATHSLQQGHMGVTKWWETYIKDPSFRVAQEVEAYGNQLREYRKNNKNKRSKVYNFHTDIAQELSSSLYGNVISFTDSFRLIGEQSL